MLDRNPKCKLFCVGDDWQSIMGFAGSNVHFFINFDKYFENPAVTKISTNYRSVKSIVDAGASIIKNNGASQIPKATVSYRDEVREIRVLRSTHKKDFELRYHEQTAEDCLSRIRSYSKTFFRWVCFWSTSPALLYAFLMWSYRGSILFLRL